MSAIGKAMAALEADNARLRAGIRRIATEDVQVPDPTYQPNNADGSPRFCRHGAWLTDGCPACVDDALLALLDGTVAPPGGTG